MEEEQEKVLHLKVERDGKDCHWALVAPASRVERGGCRGQAIEMEDQRR
jgi:hypothetical protein